MAEVELCRLLHTHPDLPCPLQSHPHKQMPPRTHSHTYTCLFTLKIQLRKREATGRQPQEQVHAETSFIQARAT